MTTLLYWRGFRRLLGSHEPLLGRGAHAMVRVLRSKGSAHLPARARHLRPNGACSWRALSQRLYVEHLRGSKITTSCSGGSIRMSARLKVISSAEGLTTLYVLQQSHTLACPHRGLRQHSSGIRSGHVVTN